MRTFFGMVLGCLLTIAAVYVHDVSATSTITSGTTVTSGTTTGQSRPAESRQADLDNRQIVNWDVASKKWNNVTDNVRQAWNRLTASVS
ncbi:hypothetical protein [Bradyrhizobium sp. LHD-71]|uniref:hypothetical protein n=1 Tax=Bradyrhizobium sp. LHD-71 TaxID=3072141 RepID=UPI00280FCA41|nr:hypothetical protein [Bradyrhizobium sp. LHD-71]MDQ8731412.1 hypothetical protein [Bradyrhizobium sp. LHD-71]